MNIKAIVQEGEYLWKDKQKQENLSLFYAYDL